MADEKKKPTEKPKTGPAPIIDAKQFRDDKGVLLKLKAAQFGTDKAGKTLCLEYMKLAAEQRYEATKKRLDAVHQKTMARIQKNLDRLNTAMNPITKIDREIERLQAKRLALQNAPKEPAKEEVKK